ncbi:hypothetical protein JHK82_052200 [Glycine max]|nr:hypothetical protein JHK86_052027 [Glycine max]KAG4926400.1 hypothetical protein JHK85_052886 [Glycine max]KAG5082035.1 hypothetical protein JHK84_052073 [Glycine max]KAG5084803.1 hypothetical protein JHK82_052200 [Glycine max]
MELIKVRSWKWNTAKLKHFKCSMYDWISNIKAKVVRLRSHHDKYMLADDDQENVFQDRNGCYMNAKWIVDVVENSNFIRLKSCYGKYLTASNMPFILRGTGKKVLQTLPTRLNSSIEWEPIREGVQVRLRTRYGQYLRGNGGLPPWRNTITHDVPHRTATANWILWDVDIVELRPQTQAPKPRPRPTPITPPNHSMNPTPTNLSPCPSPSSSPLISEMDSLVKIDLRSPTTSESEDEIECLSPLKEGRIIFYDVGNDNGDIDDAKKESFFTFKGSCASELKDKLKEETGLDDIITNKDLEEAILALVVEMENLQARHENRHEQLQSTMDARNDALHGVLASIMDKLAIISSAPAQDTLWHT